MPNALDQVVEGIGTTGRGIGPCYADKALRSTAVRMATCRPRSAAHQLHRIVPIKNATLKALCAVHRRGRSSRSTRMRCSTWLKPLAERARPAPHRHRGAAAQGRDQPTRTHPLRGRQRDAAGYRPRHVPLRHLEQLLVAGRAHRHRRPGHQVGNVIGIVKAYQTRVGGGPMPTQLDDATGDRIREVGREYGTTTGRPRRCGWIDLVALKYTATRQRGDRRCAIMLLDVLADLPELKICTGYTIDGQRPRRLPRDERRRSRRSSRCTRTLPGFAGPVDGCKIDPSELPENARGYLDVHRRLPRRAGCARERRAQARIQSAVKVICDVRCGMSDV